ncbi:MAG: peptide deformylase [Pseudomonadota bacterium]|nr:peptide deformylase [Gammaproteobacteria bacterium]MBU1926577.1 peptide deformylase [Gammaproteobacteria bacterium]MBU2546091.1 peptide deformylase [Gammaproteobacteria bacterium]
MTVRKILFYPNERLRKKAEPVEKIDDKEIQQLIDDMFETMYEFQGGGLAATQIDVHKQIIVMDPDKSQKLVLINPEIVEKSGSSKYEEGCLSLPGVSAVVQRFEHVKVKALDRNGKPFEIESTGDYLAACLQHEIDHLHGTLYIDHVSPLKRTLLIKKMKKIMKMM